MVILNANEFETKEKQKLPEIKKLTTTCMLIVIKYRYVTKNIIKL